jgi:uncharacterized membrane protein
MQIGALTMSYLIGGIALIVVAAIIAMTVRAARSQGLERRSDFEEYRLARVMARRSERGEVPAEDLRQVVSSYERRPR